MSNYQWEIYEKMMRNEDVPQMCQAPRPGNSVGERERLAQFEFGQMLARNEKNNTNVDWKKLRENLHASAKPKAEIDLINEYRIGGDKYNAVKKMFDEDI